MKDSDLITIVKNLTKTEYEKLKAIIKDNKQFYLLTAIRKLKNLNEDKLKEDFKHKFGTVS